MFRPSFPFFTADVVSTLLVPSALVLSVVWEFPPPHPDSTPAAIAAVKKSAIIFFILITFSSLSFSVFIVLSYFYVKYKNSWMLCALFLFFLFPGTVNRRSVSFSGQIQPINSDTRGQHRKSEYMLSAGKCQTRKRNPSPDLFRLISPSFSAVI